MASAVRGLGPLLRLHSTRLPAVSGAYQGQVESGVKYVKRNGLAGRCFTSWEDLNDWLERWSAEVADTRLHGTTYERPVDRFAGEQLTPLGTRLPYRYERVQQRRVANDALVTVGAARYSVPAGYAGADRQRARRPWTLRVLSS